MNVVMILRRALMGGALMLSVGVLASDGVASRQLAGTSPEFIRWMRSRNPRAAQVPETVESAVRTLGASVSTPTVCSVSVVPKSNADLPVHALGYIPPSIDFAYLQDCRKIAGQTPMVRAYAAASLPPQYDLRDENRVTSVKDQGNYGTCWAHATLGSLESLLLGAGKGAYDFSEKHLANLHGRDWGFSEGGNGDVAIAYLARLSGPIAESEDPYPDNSYYQKWNRKYNGDSSHIRDLTVSPSPVGTILKHALNAEMLTPMADGTDEEALAAIKEAVRTHGAVYCGYTHVWGAYDGTTFYWNGNNSVVDSRGGGGHAVLIVGWDDNYPKGNFKYMPPGNGAFIVKNSWGGSNGENGYNYFSYYDKTFAKGEIWSFQSCTDTNDYTGVYSYDPLGRVTQYGKGTTVAHGANMFVAKEDETLSAVGFYANAPNTSYVIDIYTNCTSKTSPVSGVKATTQSGTSKCGYFTIPLDNPVDVKSGVRFSVVVRLDTPGCNTPLAVEYYKYYNDYFFDPSGNRYDYYGSFTNGSGDVFTDESGTLYAHFYDEARLCVLKNGYWYYTGILWEDCTVHRMDLTSKAAASRGESFVSVNGTTWTDMTDDFDATANFCCKVYTTETPKQTEPAKSAAPENLRATLSGDKTSITLAWDYSHDWTTFHIWRATTAERPSSWYRFALYNPTFTDTSIAKGNVYYYWVSAKRPDGDDVQYLESDIVGYVRVEVPEDGPAAKPDIAFYAFSDKGWTVPLFLTSDYGGTVSMTSFREGDSIYLNCGVLNIGETMTSSSFISSLELFDAQGALLGKYETSTEAGLAARSGFFWGNFQWSLLSRLAPGMYSIRATVDVDNTVDESDEGNNVQEVSFDIASGITIADGVDMPLADFATGGASDWYGAQTNLACEGGDVARSGKLGPGETSWVETTFTGSGVVEVKYWSTSGVSIDIAADGGETTVAYGGDMPAGWTMYRTHFISAGTHKIRWSVTATTADEYAFLDAMKWSVAPLPGKPEIVRVVHRTGGSQNWVELEYYPPDSLAEVNSTLHRSTSRFGEKTEIAATYSFPNFKDPTADEGVAYWYWVCASNQYGAVWSDPVRTGWGFVDPTWTQPIEIPAGGTNMNIRIDSPWIAQSLDPWLAVTYKSSAKSESCEFSASPNSAGQSRPGTLRVIRYPGETYCQTNDYSIVQGWDAPPSDFEIVAGCVTGYTGAGGDIVIPSTDPDTGDSVTNIAYRAFYQKSVITSVVIPDSVVSIGTDAFRQCRNMTSVTLGSGLKAIGDNAFRTAESLVRLALPDSLETIGQYAFAECSSLEDIDFGQGLSNIMGYAFMSCKKLTAVSFPESLRCMGRAMMDGCSGLQEATFANGVTNIPRTCFNNCKALSSVCMPGTVARIEQSAFYGCTNLTVVSMSEGLEVIEQNAFSTCRGMGSIAIPASVTNIEAHAFYQCSTLTNVMYKGNAPTVVVDIYEGATNVVSYVTALSTGWGGDGLDWPSDGLFPVSDVESKQKHRRPIVRGNVHDVTPEPPVILTCVGDGNGVVLTWGEANRAMTYSIYRSTGMTCPDVPIADGVTSTCFTNGVCEAGVDYWYWVEAVNNGGKALCAAPVSGWRRFAARMTHDDIAFAYDGSEVDLVVNANAAWTYVKTGDWFDLDARMSGPLSGTLTLTTEKNPTVGMRSGSIVVTVGGNDAHPAAVYQIPVSQAAPPAGRTETPVIVPCEGFEFTSETNVITITCATPGAVIYYTIDGKTPRPTAPFRYGGPFTIDRSVEICTFAECEGFARSEFAEATVTKVIPESMTLAGSIELAGENVLTDMMDGWMPVVDSSAVGGSSARSGEIGLESSSRMSWRVPGAGTVTFRWRSECEADPRGRYSYDFGSFSVDGVATNLIDGMSVGWVNVSIAITGDGEHVLEWGYTKDGFDEPDFGGEDCIWVDNVAWQPSDVTIEMGDGRSLVIPLSWFERFYPKGAAYYGYESYAEMSLSPSGKSDGKGRPLKIWHDYVAGTDPTDLNSIFKVTSFIYEDGKITITWDPDLNESGTKSVRRYKVYGAETLGQTLWDLIETDHPDSKYKFFAVDVDMP